MIKFENTQVDGWAAAIRGMRNPLNSWDKSDSKFDDYDRAFYEIGENDLKLMHQLVKAGSDHSKFMRMINVTVDIIAPRYWWAEFDTYKVGTVRNSCSTMHTIHKKPFTLDDFSTEHIDGDSMWCMNMIIKALNDARIFYLASKDKNLWYTMIQLLPASYNQRATVQLNYAVLRNMYGSRQHHKLDEWSQGFTKWVDSLPYSELITGCNNEAR